MTQQQIHQEQEECLEQCCPTAAHLHELAILQTAAFPPQCCESMAQVQRQNYLRYQTSPGKLSHCRMVRLSQTGVVVAACQLQKRPRNHQVYVEWIGCHRDYQNQGLGSQLLAWAAWYAYETWHASVLTLYVKKANRRAVQWYQRRGYVVQEDDHSNSCWNRWYKVLFFPCQYCFLDHVTVCQMDKNLLLSEEEQQPDDPSDDEDLEAQKSR